MDCILTSTKEPGLYKVKANQTADEDLDVCNDVVILWRYNVLQGADDSHQTEKKHVDFILLFSVFQCTAMALFSSMMTRNNLCRKYTMNKSQTECNWSYSDKHF